MRVQANLLPDPAEQALKHLSCARCRKCGSVTRPHVSMTTLIHGVETIVRERKCSSPTCSGHYRTAEVPLDVAHDIWGNS